MQELLVTFETAKLAKEKGFDWEVLFCYEVGSNLLSEERTLEGGHYNYNYEGSDSYSAPTQSLLQKWLREVHNIHIIFHDSYNKDTKQIKYYPVLFLFGEEHGIISEDREQYYTFLGDVWQNTYEEALEIGLQESLKLIP